MMLGCRKPIRMSISLKMSSRVLSFSFLSLPGGGSDMILQAICSPVSLSVTILTTEKPAAYFCQDREKLALDDDAVLLYW